MNVAPNEFSLKIAEKDGAGYKSIRNLVWDNIPGFAIISGRNGSGKTQLLELLAHHFSGTVPHPPPHFSTLPVTIETRGTNYSPDEVGFVPSEGRFSGGGGASLANMPNLIEQAKQLVQQRGNNRHDVGSAAKAHAMQKWLGRLQSTGRELDLALGDNVDFMLQDVDVTAGLTHVFMAYRFKVLEGLERGKPGFDRAGKPLGVAPWIVVNDSLSVAEFPYEMLPPSETPLLETYELRLRDKRSGAIIHARDLSSGEKVLLQLVLWLFTAGKEGVFPKLLILDEPDAHLHPAMTTQFITIIAEVLVAKYGVRVIMSSHSPSTVALAPPGSIFILDRGGSEIRRVENRSDIISILTSGLVTVTRATKFCFVEDNDDVDFYEAVRDVLTDYGPSKDKMPLLPSPTMAFIPVSVGSGPTRVSGGATIVKKWIEKLDSESLERTFLGIVDRDINNQGSPRVFVLGRYSFENYLVDPLVLYAVLLEAGNAPAIPGIKLTPGDEHLIRMQDQETLQSIANAICAAWSDANPNLNSEKQVSVTYTNSLSIDLPSWQIDYRGHDLFQSAQRAFGMRLITPPNLLRGFRRCRMIPAELRNTLATLQET